MPWYTQVYKGEKCCAQGLESLQHCEANYQQVVTYLRCAFRSIALHLSVYHARNLPTSIRPRRATEHGLLQEISLSPYGRAISPVSSFSSWYILPSSSRERRFVSGISKVVPTPQSIKSANISMTWLSHLLVPPLFANGPRRACAKTAPTLPAPADSLWAVDLNRVGKTSPGTLSTGSASLMMLLGGVKHTNERRRIGSEVGEELTEHV